MEDLQLKIGTVISNDDSDRKGRIQVKIIPELKDIKDADAPWAKPFTTKQDKTGNTLKKDYFPKGSLIRVLVSKDWQSFYYLDNLFLQGLFNFDTAASLLDGVSPISYDYVTLEFKLYENGNLWFNDNANGTTGIIHNTGKYVVLDADGNICLSSDEDNAVRYSKLEEAFNTLKDDLNSFINTYNNHTHILSGVAGPYPLSGSATPSTSSGSPSSADISGAKVEDIKIS
ncbi:MAG: hypothetical protein GF311_28495 [Candidatus Lokiarchaeota archaeon]|nr:hypothetical protein [Candidatus Lokiarchaeota archaeon]